MVLILLNLGVYWQIQNHDFVSFDDDLFILENRNIRSGLTLKAVDWAFHTSYPDYWHPLPWISHMLDYHLYGLNPKGHYLNNLLIHIINSILLFLLFSRITNAPFKSAFVSLLFAIHPLHVESVAWVTARKDLLSTLFWILTTYAYVYYVLRPGVWRYLSVIFFYILGLMSKPMLVTLPFVLLLIDYWPLQRFNPGNPGNLSTDNAANPLSSLRKFLFSCLRLHQVYSFLLPDIQRI